jgi:hypothetical protein
VAKVTFESKLPGDVADQKEAIQKSQQTIDSHLREKKLSEQVIPYSDKLFKQAAIEWLIAKDQVCLLD